ncbi:MAG: YihY/virulence factor BrkB family protein [Actinomycetota bacterium]|nr:YihY/virulence factor BrkB family protein [Actinomycetota bacterium]
MTRAPHRVRSAVRRFFRIALGANLTGLSSMVAYSMLLTVVPVALLGLFVAGQVLKSGSVEHSVLRDLSEIFPGATKATLAKLLKEVRVSTTNTGVLALIASVWFGASFWGALDTAFAHIYGLPQRSWWAQKRFGLAMLLVLLVFMISMVAAPTVVSLLQAGARDLPFDLARVGGLVYRISLGLAVILLFGSLCVIYKAVPNDEGIPWRAVWPGAAVATLVIALVALVFPLYLAQISTIAQFGTTIVFVLIVLAWFYVLAIIILGGGVVNSMRLSSGEEAAVEVAPAVAAPPEVATPG